MRLKSVPNVFFFLPKVLLSVWLEGQQHISIVLTMAKLGVVYDLDVSRECLVDIVISQTLIKACDVDST